MRESKIIVKLPKADIKTPPDQVEPAIITINSRNEVFLNNRPRTLQDLRKELEALLTFNKMRPVIVRADRSVVIDRVVQVLDVAKNAGAEKIGISCGKEKPPPITQGP